MKLGRGRGEEKGKKAMEGERESEWGGKVEEGVKGEDERERANFCDRLVTILLLLAPPRNTVHPGS